MSSITVARNLVLLAAAGGLGYYAYDGLKKVARVDPFSALRPSASVGVPDTVLVELKDVKLRHYKDGKLVTEAVADSVDVNKDRVTFALNGVRDGKTNTKKGPIQFSASNASWNSAIKMLAMDGNTRVKGPGFDFSAPTLTLDENRKLFAVPEASGRLSGGIASIRGFVHNYADGSSKSGPARFIGQLPQQEKSLPLNSRTSWDISADSLGDTGESDKVQTFNEANATDGEVLIKAPKVTLDRKTDVLTATGRVFYYSAKANLVADKIVVYRREKRAVLTGNVFLLAKPKEEVPNYKPTEEELPPFKPMVPDDVKANRPPEPESGVGPAEKALDKKLRDGATLREFPLIVTGDDVEYFYKKGERRALIKGNPQARQEIPGGRWRHVWSHQAFYDGEKETLLATSKEGDRNVRIKNSLGDDLTGLTVTLSTKEGDSRYSGEKLKGTVTTDAEDDPREKPAVKPPAVKPPAVIPPEPKKEERKGGG